jgi:hypothetical protein
MSARNKCSKVTLKMCAVIGTLVAVQPTQAAFNSLTMLDASHGAYSFLSGVKSFFNPSVTDLVAQAHHDITEESQNVRNDHLTSMVSSLDTSEEKIIGGVTFCSAPDLSIGEHRTRPSGMTNRMMEEMIMNCDGFKVILCQK